MFKSSLLSGWFRKPAPVSTETVDSTFTVPGRDTSHLYQVSMNENLDEFVDIACRKLSYAEVALLSKDKQQTSKKQLAVPKSHRVNENQYEVLADEDELTGSVHMAPEKLKVNNYFYKKVYKDADKNKSKKKRAPARK